MKKNKFLSYLGLTLAVLGTAGFIFLYNYPYNSVNFTKLSYQNYDLTNLNLNSSNIANIEKIEETNDFTSAISAYNLKSITDYNDFKTKANISLENNYEDNFSKQNNILAISFKGSAITNSKATKFKIDNNLIKITIGVENDFILTGKDDKDENTYTYYLFPYSSNNEIENITVSAGDTLWSIACEYKKDEQDVRDYIYELRKLNNLTDCTIYPGQEIQIIK